MRGWTRTVAVAMAALLGLAGCGREGGREGGRAGAREEVPPQAAEPFARGARAAFDSSVTSELRPVEGEVLVNSREGRFAALFPEGCGRVQVRAFPSDAEDGNFTNVQLTAERSGRTDEGVMVRCYFALRGQNGGPPTPVEVTNIIKETVRQFGLRIKEQHAVARPGVEGVRVRCEQPNGVGSMWFQGLLAGERAYIMSAWRPGEDGLTEAQVERFFDSFRPRTDS